MTTLKKKPAGKRALAKAQNLDALVAEGADILTRIGKGAHLEDWLKVGAGLNVGVQLALKSGDKRSAPYNAEMREWLDANPAYGDDKLDKDNRAALINLFSTPGAVKRLQADLKTMAPGEIQRMATPRAAWDRIKADFVPVKEKRKRPERGPSTATELEGTIGDLQTRLAGAIDLALSPEGLAEAIAEAWKDEVLRSKLIIVHSEISVRLAAEKRAKGNGKGKVKTEAEAF